MGQGASGPAQQHPDHDARELEHTRLPHQRLRHRGRRRLARTLPQGRNPDRWCAAEEHARSNGRHRAKAVGEREGALRVVQRSLPAAERRQAAQGAIRAVSRLHPGRLHPQSMLLGRRELRRRQALFRCGRQPLERPELDAGLAVGCHPQHRRRHDQVRPQRDCALSADHRIQQHGRRWHRVGHRRDARQSLGRLFQPGKSA